MFVKLFSRPTPQEVRQRQKEQAELELAHAEAALEAWEFNVLLLKSRLERLNGNAEV